jgi:hypothetical protein
MSKPVFYSELIILEEFNQHLRERGLAEHEVLSLLNDLAETFHTKTLDLILEELPVEHHEEFLVLFSDNPEDVAHWDFLHTKSPSLKERVVAKLNDFKANLLAELRR